MFGFVELSASAARIVGTDASSRAVKSVRAGFMACSVFQAFRQMRQQLVEEGLMLLHQGGAIGFFGERELLLHMLPNIRLPLDLLDRSEALQVKLAFLLLGRMTRHAVVAQQRPNRLVERLGGETRSHQTEHKQGRSKLESSHVSVHPVFQVLEISQVIASAAKSVGRPFQAVSCA